MYYSTINDHILDDNKLNIVDLLKKYKIEYRNGCYHWEGKSYISYKEALLEAKSSSTFIPTHNVINTPKGIYSNDPDDNVPFAFERKLTQKGFSGGILMIFIASVWFFIGLEEGYIFFYPLILALIGIYCVLKGLSTESVHDK